MIVDQDETEIGVLPGVSGEVDFADRIHGELLEKGERVEIEVFCRDVDVVDVEQQAATRSLDQFGQELGFAHGRSFQSDIGRQVLDQDTAAERLLHQVEVAGHDGERLLVVAERQEVVEERAAGPRPGQVF